MMRVRTDRPVSEMLVDLHVYIVPPDLWQDQLHSASNEIISDTISAGFLRVLPETTVHCLRDEIPKQIGFELIPSEYVFLKSVGRCLTRVKAKQEHQMKVKHFLPPHAYCPEIFLLEPTQAMKGLISSDDESSRASYDYRSAAHTRRDDKYQAATPRGDDPPSRHSLPLIRRISDISNASQSSEKQSQISNQDDLSEEVTLLELGVITNDDSEETTADSREQQSRNRSPLSATPDSTLSDHIGISKPELRQAKFSHGTNKDSGLGRTSEQVIERGELKHPLPAESPRTKPEGTTSPIEQSSSRDSQSEKGLSKDSSPSRHSRKSSVSGSETGTRQLSRESRAESKSRAGTSESHVSTPQESHRNINDTGSKMIGVDTPSRKVEESPLSSARDYVAGANSRSTSRLTQRTINGAGTESNNASTPRHSNASEQEIDDMQEKNISGTQSRRTTLSSQNGEKIASPQDDESSKRPFGAESDRDREYRDGYAKQGRSDEYNQESYPITNGEHGRDSSRHASDDVRNRQKENGLNASSNEDFANYTSGKKSEPPPLLSAEEQYKLLKQQLATARHDRKNLEIRREEMVKKAKYLQSKTQSRRNQARDVWKKRYFDEKKRTPPLEEKSNRLRLELEALHRKIVGQMEGTNQRHHKSDQKVLKPSSQNNLRINATKLNHEIEELQRRVDDSKMKLTGEVKLRNQAEAELRRLRTELTQRKINVTLTRSQRLANMQDDSSVPPESQRYE